MAGGPWLSSLVAASSIASRGLSGNLTPEGLQGAARSRRPFQGAEHLPMGRVSHCHSEQQRVIQGQQPSLGSHLARFS